MVQCCRPARVEQFTAAPATRHELCAFQASTESISSWELVNHSGLWLFAVLRLRNTLTYLWNFVERLDRWNNRLDLVVIDTWSQDPASFWRNFTTAVLAKVKARVDNSRKIRRLADLRFDDLKAVLAEICALRSSASGYAAKFADDCSERQQHLSSLFSPIRLARQLDIASHPQLLHLHHHHHHHHCQTVHASTSAVLLNVPERWFHFNSWSKVYIWPAKYKWRSRRLQDEGGGSSLAVNNRKKQLRSCCNVSRTVCYVNKSTDVKMCRLK